MKITALPSLFLLSTVMVFAAGLTPQEWQARSAATRAAMSRMDKLINSDDQETAYDQYMAMFHPAVKAWGLYENQAADLDHIKAHYRPVFFELEGGVLVSDQVIVAGPMAAQRYHSMMLLNGVFDGVEAKDKPVVIRGQTFFHIDEEGLILERWSNHDHAYRMGQLLGEEGHKAGQSLASRLNGPGLTETQGIEALQNLLAAFNQPEAPARRERDVRRLLSPNMQLHGIDAKSKNAYGAMNFLTELWFAYPDLMLSTGTPLSGWSFVAAEWQASGSQRQEFRGEFHKNSPACIQGQMILRLSDTGLIEEAWVDVSDQCIE